MITIHQDNKPIYNINFSEDFISLRSMLRKLDLKNRQVCIVTDSTVGKYYIGDVVEIVKDYCRTVETFTFPAGEKSKNLDVVSDLYEKLITEKFDRNDYLLALGGGVVGDLTGFAAASYLRGIAFVQIPTTLLAMVDSSIGGKTGVDFRSYKNMVGAFYQPKAVYMNISALNTLTNKQYFSGFGEIIKHGCIKDAVYFEKIYENRAALCEREPAILSEVVQSSCLIKKAVVENDPKEKGERALLNFGHTIGHAIEKKLSDKLLHGECVSIGMVAASYISFQRNQLTEQELLKIIDCLSALKLPIDLKDYILDTEELYQITLNDKKMSAGQIRFILLRGIGNAYIDTTVTKEEMIEAIDYVLSGVNRRISQ